MKEGNKMAGPCMFPYGPIHPCPSIWEVNWTFPSFRPRLKTHAPDPKICDAVKMLEWLIEQKFGHEAIHAHTALWDTALDAWYWAAIHGKAKVTSGVGINHEWLGREKQCPQD